MTDTSASAAAGTASAATASTTPGTAAPAAAAPVRDDRPYFVPASVDYAALPEDVRRALVGIVGPVYDQFVVHALTPMERAAGNSLAFVLTLEVLHEFDVARVIDFSAQGKAAKHRARLVEDHMRLVAIGQISARFMLRVHALRKEPYTGTLRRLPVL